MTPLRLSRSRTRSIAAARMPLLLLMLALLVCAASALRLSSPTHAYDGYPWTSKGRNPGLYPHTFAVYVQQDPLSYNVTAPLVRLDGTLGGASNSFLCSPVTSPDQMAQVRGKVILALRGGGSDCRFFLRSQYALAAGAVGLVIADDNPQSLTFDPQFMGPSADELVSHFDTPVADVQIPTIYVLHSTFVDLTEINDLNGQPYWVGTTASLSAEGLVFTMADYEALIARDTRFDGLAKAVVVGFPLVAALYCYLIWYGAWREARNSPQRQQQQQQQQPAAPAPAAAQGAQQQGQAPPVQQQQQQQHAVAVDDAAHDDASRAGQQPQFSEGDMQSISLPIPPHLSSGDTPADGSAESSSAHSSQNSSAGLAEHSSSSRGEARARSLSLQDDEGALLGRPAHDDLADHDLASPLPASGGANVSGNRSALGRPLLPLPAPSVALSQKLYYHLLKSLSMLGKPLWILRLNFVVYVVHIVTAAAVLMVAYGENCISNQTSMVSLWCARALIGLRICYWQTHSSTFRPTCLDIFFKNWADCIFLFTGSLSSFSEAQKHDCEVNAPITTRWVDRWVIVIFVSYGAKIVLYGCDRLAQHYGTRTPHLFAIASRSFLSLCQGGFSCAGALDANQPATQLDLMLIPVVRFADGMYAADDAVCGVCLGEYAAGEELRVLGCTHHFHKDCVDTWLQLKNTCPTCRSSIDSAVAQRRPSPQPVAVPVARQQEQGVEMRSVRMERPPSPSRQMHDEDHYAYSAAEEV